MELILICFLIAGVSLMIVKISQLTADKAVEKIHETTRNGMDRISAELSKLSFTTTRRIALNYFLELYSAPIVEIRVDSYSKRIAICNYETAKFACIAFRDILDCKLLEDQNIIHSSSLGRAAVGTVVAGSTGAIVGAISAKDKIVVHSLSIRVVTAKVDSPQVVLETLSADCRKDSEDYQHILNHAREIYSIFDSIILSNKSTN